MLREIFRTVPIPFLKEGDPLAQDLGRGYTPNVAPWLENFGWVSGIFMQTDVYPYESSAPSAAGNLLVFSIINTAWWPSWGIGYYRFDPWSGKFLRRIMLVGGGLGAVDVLMTVARYMQQSRSGKFYLAHIWGRDLYKIGLGKSATGLMFDPRYGQEDNPADMFVYDTIESGARFVKDSGYFYAPFAIDDTPGVVTGPSELPTENTGDYYLSTNGRVLRVFRWTTGEWLYDFTMPGNIADISLQEQQRAYVLLNNGVVVLFDYVRGEITGANKIPSLQGGATYWNNSNVRISWDSLYHRLLVAEVVPNNSDGSSATVVRGFWMVPEPARLTRPIPLKAPRQRRTIPVMTQIVDDLNYGVGGYLVEALVSGSGSLVGIPLTKHDGSTLIQVACEGSESFVQSPATSDPSSDWSVTGSPDATPPNAGLTVVTASITVPKLALKEVPVSGVPGPTPGKPGPPGGGGGTAPSTKETAPNMKYVVDNVYNSGHWKFDGGNAYDQTQPDGRGGFTEAVVKALHDIDPRWGFLMKGGNNYNGHAVDAIIFLNDDGVTGESFDIAGSHTSWIFIARDAKTRTQWRYPL